MDVKALFVDAAGTLLRPREPVGFTYARAALRAGHVVGPFEVQHRFDEALRGSTGNRQRGDGRAFWRPIVYQAIGAKDPAVFEDLYEWYAQPRAWWIDTEALLALSLLARQGVRLGIISNWDRRLRTLYERFALERMFSVLICSAEVGVEKPDPLIFTIACRAAGVSPRQAVHLGDNVVDDVNGAAAAGLTGLLHEEDDGWRTLPARIATLRRTVHW